MNKHRLGERVGGVHASAEIDASAQVHPTADVWGLAQIRDRATVGAGCIIGRGVYIGPGVVVGDRTKIQNSALIYDPAVIEANVFIGPGVIFTNDRTPRAVTSDGQPKGPADWKRVGVRVELGASVGAGAVCVAPVRIGAWALVGAGAVVSSDVPSHALVVGVPARRIGWVGRSGERLEYVGNGAWRCPVTREIYSEDAGGLQLVTGAT